MDAGNLSTVAAIEAAALRHPRIRRLELILTEGCNLACSYCFEYGADSKKEMSFEVATHCLSQLARKWSRQATAVGVSFMGGEPLLKIDLIERILEYSRLLMRETGKTLSFDMQTNGLLLNEDTAQLLAAHKVKYCLSIDGAKETQDRFRKTRGGMGTYDRVSQLMPMLRRYQPWQGTRMTVTPQDAQSLATNIKTLHEELVLLRSSWLNQIRFEC